MHCVTVPELTAALWGGDHPFTKPEFVDPVELNPVAVEWGVSYCKCCHRDLTTLTSYYDCKTETTPTRQLLKCERGCVWVSEGGS